MHPDSVPRLCIEVGNRLNPADRPIILWETTVSDSHIRIDFAPAVTAWSDWLNRQPPPPTMAEQQTLRNDLIVISIILACFLALMILMT